MTRIFVVEKYAIARDVTLFEEDAQARDATLFWRRAPSSVIEAPLQIPTESNICIFSCKLLQKGCRYKNVPFRFHKDLQTAFSATANLLQEGVSIETLFYSDYYRNLTVAFSVAENFCRRMSLLELMFHSDSTRNLQSTFSAVANFCKRVSLLKRCSIQITTET